MLSGQITGCSDALRYLITIRLQMVKCLTILLTAVVTSLMHVPSSTAPTFLAEFWIRIEVWTGKLFVSLLRVALCMQMPDD
jgi:hypothetical protein